MTETIFTLAMKKILDHDFGKKNNNSFLLSRSYSGLYQKKLKLDIGFADRP